MKRTADLDSVDKRKPGSPQNATGLKKTLIQLRISQEAVSKLCITMADTEAARSIHHVDLDEKSDEKSLAKGQGIGYSHLLTDEQELFLNRVQPEEQDKIFRKVRHPEFLAFVKSC